MMEDSDRFDLIIMEAGKVVKRYESLSWDDYCEKEEDHLNRGRFIIGTKVSSDVIKYRDGEL